MLRYAGAAFVAGAGRLAARLSLRAARILGALLGELAFWVIPGRRRVALANLALAYGPALDAGRRRTLARASFRHLGITAFECCRLYLGASAPLFDRIRVEGLEHVKAAMAKNRGLLFLSAHFGNWELLAAAHGLTGFPASAVVRPLDNPFLEAVVAQGRQRTGLRLIPKRAALRGIRSALARGECVGIMLDQNAGPEGVFVPFFGHLASTSRSLALLALKTGAPVVPAFLRRLPGGDHELTLEAAIPVTRTGHLQHDIEINTARFTETVERHVRAQPDQWFWVHRRWKHRPA